jgi:GTP cyclohydrolase II
MAQKGGCGIVIYYQGRSLGEVTKYLVYNTQEGDHSAELYFSCTEQVAGVQDARFQVMMPDPALHFLGVTKIPSFISMPDRQYNAICFDGDQDCESH